MTANAALAEMRAEKHISVSSIGTYLRCPRQYEFRYVRKTPPGHRPAPLAFGSAFHATLATFYDALKAGMQEPAKKDLQAVFEKEWRRQLDGETPVLLDEKQSPESLLETGQAMLATYVDEVPRPHKAIGVEEAFSVEILDQVTGEVLPARLVGAYDLVVQDEDGSYRIVEIKTGVRRWTKDKLAFDNQITAYHLAAPLLGLGKAKVDVHLVLKTKQPALEIYSPVRTKSDYDDFLRVASGVIRAVDAGIFYPVRDWQCHSCQFAGPCLDG